MKRRRVTTETKKKPSIAEVRERMVEIQEKIVELGLQGTGLVFNFDETGVRWAEALKYQFVPEGASTAERWGLKATRLGGSRQWFVRRRARNNL